MGILAGIIERLTRLHETADHTWRLSETGSGVLEIGGRRHSLGRDSNARLAAEMRSALPLLLEYIRMLEARVQRADVDDQVQPRPGYVRPVDGLGRIVIPADIRCALDIRPGDRVEIATGPDNRLVITKAQCGRRPPMRHDATDAAC